MLFILEKEDPDTCNNVDKLHHTILSRQPGTGNTLFDPISLKTKKSSPENQGAESRIPVAEEG